MKKLLLFSFVGLIGSAFTQPVNDQCVAASNATIGNVINFNTASATNNGPQVEFDEIYKDIWYSFTASALRYTVSLCNSSFDTKLAAYQASSCASIVSESHIEYNDDGGCFNGGNSEITFDAVSGQKYYIRVGGYDASSFGVGQLLITTSPIPTPPANDLCANAQNLFYAVEASFISDNATDDQMNTSTVGVIHNDVWYYFFAPYNLTYDVTTCGSDYDTKIAVYQANNCSTITDFSDIAGDDDNFLCSSNGASSFTQFTGTAGTKYYIQVGGFNEFSAGNGKILITHPEAGINEEVIESFEMYPNPASETINLTFQNNRDKEIKILDQSGRIVFHLASNHVKESINVDSFETGIYHIEVIQANGKVTQKFVKN